MDFHNLPWYTIIFRYSFLMKYHSFDIKAAFTTEPSANT